ncbi:MAG: hypothetical protein PHI26_04515 [Atopobiaceae bacterium]|nr:hypothetical protein [Atopobiaceae bacterium]
MGRPIEELDPMTPDAGPLVTLELLASHGRLVPSLLGSLHSIRSDKPRLVFTVDTEFYYPDASSTERLILTWQVSFVDPRDPGHIHEVVFYAKNARKRLSLGRALAYIIERFSLASTLGDNVTTCPDNGYRYEATRRWIVPTKSVHGTGWASYRPESKAWITCKSPQEALESCGDTDFKKAYEELVAKRPRSWSKVRLPWDRSGLAGYVNDLGPYHRRRSLLPIPVTVLCHAGKADLTAFVPDAYEPDILCRLSEVQGGLVSMKAFGINPHCPTEFWRFYPLDVEVRDTMCYAPTGMKSLDDLGRAVGVPKLELPNGYTKDAMDKFLLGDPTSFLDYASQDCVTTMCYAATLYGWNVHLPVTTSSSDVHVARDLICDELGIGQGRSRFSEFDRKFRGVCRKNLGKVKNPRTGRLVNNYVDDYPVSDDAGLLQEYARNAFHGGYNGCSKPGWINTPTCDLDLENAYPSLMSLVCDIDWDDPHCVEHEFTDRDLSLKDFRTPFDPMFCYVDAFEFPRSVPYPCIPLNIDGNLVFPRTLGERDGVYCTGIEIWLALKLGARIHVHRGFVGKCRHDSSGHPTHLLLGAVRQLVRDRRLLKTAIKHGQLELEVFQLLVKTMVNSLFGKTAQNVVEKLKWDAFKQEMDDLGCSAITSPTHAAMITASVRCVLCAAMNEVTIAGGEVYSCTTDGMIASIGEDDANSLSLYGLADYLKAARVELVGDPKVWAVKPVQDDFLNITTRGNVAPNEGGVLAHNSFVTGLPKDSPEDRLSFLDQVLTRTGRIHCMTTEWARFKDMSRPTLREDFYVGDLERDMRMDFDMKRRPVEGSLVTERPVVDGRAYEVATVGTVPYDTPEEFEAYRRVARSMRSGCLRTEDDWRGFLVKVRSSLSGAPAERHVKDPDWSRLFTCVMGHRLRQWRVPTLDDPALSVEDKCAWVNQFDKSKKAFTPADWKNARRQTRQSQMLPRECVADMLQAMGAVGVSLSKAHVYGQRRSRNQRDHGLRHPRHHGRRH